MRTSHVVGLLALAAFLPVAGYGIMRGLIYLFPMQDDTHALLYVFYTALMIALGLMVPYWMLKAGAKAAEKRDGKNESFHLRDLSKDQDDLAVH